MPHALKRHVPHFVDFAGRLLPQSTGRIATAVAHSLSRDPIAKLRRIHVPLSVVHLRAPFQVKACMVLLSHSLSRLFD